MKSTIEKITPRKAKAWLAIQSANRHVTQSSVDYLAAAMTAGEWMLNGESIKRNCDGSVIDGQHRLLAVILSGVTIESYVVHGLDSDAYETIDQGRPRGHADVLSRMGVENYTLMAASLRAIICYERYGMPVWSVKIRGTEIAEAYDSHPRLQECAKFIRQHSRAKVLPQSLATFLLYVSSERKPRKAFQFFELLNSGEGLVKDDPVHSLREKMLRAQGAKEFGRVARAVIAAKALNCYLANKPMPMKSLRYVDGENFPKV